MTTSICGEKFKWLILKWFNLKGQMQSTHLAFFLPSQSIPNPEAINKNRLAKSCHCAVAGFCQRLWIVFACMPVHKASKVRGNIPKVPATKNCLSRTPQNALKAFVIAKGNTGDKRVTNTHEKEFARTFARKCSKWNLDLSKAIMASPFNFWAKKYPSKEAKL